MTDKSVLVSIITVTYNAENFITKTIESVALQDYPYIEYIIVDGASTDHTVEIIKKHQSVVTKWISEPDNGIYDAMNKGIQIANGELIGMINASDYYEPNAISEVVKAYLHYADGEIFHGNIHLLNEDGSFFKLKKPDADVSHLPNGFALYHPTFFVTKAAYTKYGLYDTHFRIAADFDFTLRAYLADAKFIYIDKAISNFRRGGISATAINAQIESKNVLLKNGISEETANATLQQWEKAAKTERIAYQAYIFLRRLLPNTMVRKITAHISTKRIASKL